MEKKDFCTCTGKKFLMNIVHLYVSRYGLDIMGKEGNENEKTLA